MINTFQPKGLGEKWHSFCISNSQAVGTQGFTFCLGKKPLAAQVPSLSPSFFFSLLHVLARSHTHTGSQTQTHTHSIDQQPLGTNLALCVHWSCTNASNTSVIYCNQHHLIWISNDTATFDEWRLPIWWIISKEQVLIIYIFSKESVIKMQKSSASASASEDC